MAEKVCRDCRVFVRGSRCPHCNGNNFSQSWKGIIYVNDPAASEVAQLVGIRAPGKYCLWVK